MRKAPAFTLVELLVTLSLVALVAGAAAAILSGGLSVWERGQNQGLFDQQMRLSLEAMKRDLRNAGRFKPIPFEGSYDTFSFPAWVETELKDGSILQEVGRAGFFLDAPKRRLCRSRHPYRLVRSHSLRSDAKSLATGVDRLRFSYGVPDPATGGITWKGSISSEEPPLAVKIEVATYDRTQGGFVARTAIVRLPTGSIPQKKEG